MQAVNFGDGDLNLDVEVLGISAENVVAAESYITLMTSAELIDENSFANQTKVQKFLPLRRHIENWEYFVCNKTWKEFLNF